MKKLKYFIFLILFSLFSFNVDKVKAVTYSLENRSSSITFYPSNQNIRFTNNTLYYHGVANDYSYIYNLGLNTISSDREDKTPIVFNGRYLIDFYLYGVGGFDNLSCNNYYFTPRYYTTTDGLWRDAVGSCIDIYKTKYNGYDSYHILFEFTYKDYYGADGTDQFNFIISSAYPIIQGGGSGLNYGFSFGSIQTYSQTIVDQFVDVKNQQTQINQNDTIINQNTEINNSINNVNDSINNSNVDDPSSAINSFKNNLATNGVITQLVTLPVTLFTNVLNSVNGTCASYNLGSLFGTDLILPCISISNYIGNTLWSVIDVLISGFFVYAMSRKFIKVFENLSSMKEGDVIGD